MHLTERVEQNMVIVFGKDLQSFRKRLIPQLERKFIFAKISNDVSMSLAVGMT